MEVDLILFALSGINYLYRMFMYFIWFLWILPMARYRKSIQKIAVGSLAFIGEIWYTEQKSYRIHRQ